MTHRHQHFDHEAGNQRIYWAIAVNVLLTVVQLIGGVLAGSLALMADALHNLSDASSLVIALVARRIAIRPVDDQQTFGYRRAEVVAALINLTVLLVIGGYLVLQGVMRLLDPQPVTGWLVVLVASVALVVDVITVFLTHPMADQSLNMRAVLLHNLADALTSLGVIIAGVLIMLFDFHLADVLVTFLVAGFVLYHAGHDIRRVIAILMNATPPHLDINEVRVEVEKLAGVDSLHHIHLWSLDESEHSFDAHVVVIAGLSSPVDLQPVRLAIKRCLAEEFGIHHSTLEFEFLGSGSGPGSAGFESESSGCAGGQREH
ncbi:MAG: cation transporter [Gammaproteobacteria bacterium]|nr:MAG: cation transporter [Gammaproteobacteria bacterium]RLA11820.1 MAG: cation transporter [Gammaproteobacteria bacterium]